MPPRGLVFQHLIRRFLSPFVGHGHGQRVLELGFVQMIVQAPLCQQIGVAADLFDPSVFHRDDFIRVHDRREAVGNNQSRAPDHQLVERILNELFALAVECRSRFIQDQDTRVAQEGAGDGEALLLAP